MFLSNLAVAGSEFHRVGAATEKTRVSAFASLRFASLRFASLRFASLRFASLRFASLLCWLC